MNSGNLDVCFKDRHLADAMTAPATVRLPKADREQGSNRRGCQCFRGWRLRGQSRHFLVQIESYASCASIRNLRTFAVTLSFEGTLF